MWVGEARELNVLATRPWRHMRHPEGLYVLTGNDVITHQLLPVSHNSQNLLFLWLFSDQDFWIVVYLISMKFTDFEMVIQALHFLFDKSLGIFAL